MRIVEEKVVVAGGGYLQSGQSSSQDYLERVAKYVPAEIIAAYISANGVAAMARDPKTLFILIFITCAVCVPLYISRLTKKRKEFWTNSAMGVVAFGVWAYAMGGGIVKYLDWYDAPTASVVLILFTLISGFIVPVTKRAAPNAELKA